MFNLKKESSDLVEADNNNCEATTIVVTDRASFAWNIKNFFTSVWEPDESILSPSFMCSGISWRLQIYPNGECKHNTGGKIGLYLVYDSILVNKRRVKFKFSVLGKNEEKFYSSEFEFTYENKVKSWGKPNFFERTSLLDYKDEFVPNDTFTVLCEILGIKRIVHGTVVSTFEGNKKCAETKDKSSLVVCLDKLSNDFAALYGKAKYADVTLKAGNKEVRAHKMVLIARSPVFAAMFDHDTEEKRNSEVNIIDMEASVLDDMLWYMYSGKVSNMNLEKAIGLFLASDKYALEKLKEECVIFMLANLTVDNVCDIAVLGDTYNEERLKESVKSFLRENISTIAATNKWKDLMRENPRLTSDLLQAIVCNSSSMISSATI